MEIVEKDFTMRPSSVGSDRFDLTFMKRVKKRDSGQYAIEPGDTLYGLTLEGAFKRIILHRTAKKYEEENISLKEFIAEYKRNFKEIKEILYGTK